MAADLLHLTLILIITLGFVLLLRLFKQPPILSYIIAGLVAGPALLGWTADTEFIGVFSSLGIAFLLFVVGIDLDFRSLKTLGIPVVIIGLGQVLLTGIIVFIATLFFGIGLIASLYLAIALTFSSTIIVIKLLTDRKQLDSLHGKISVGILLIQDLVAVLALLFISTLAQGHESVLMALGLTLFKGIMVALLAWGINVYLLPQLLKASGKEQEVLFLFSLTWCFAFATLFEIAGFGIEIGALLAGVMLAGTPYSYEIASRIKPLRDFFIILFFILLGAQMDAGTLSTVLPIAAALSALIIFGKPLIIMLFMGLQGFSKRTSFLTGVTLAQISEFSLIVIALGVSVGHLSGTIATYATLTGLLTIVVSTYLSKHGPGLYQRAQHWIPFYRRGVHHHEHRHERHITPHDVILLGHNRVGSNIIHQFTKRKKEFLVVDYNPQVVLDLQEQKYDAMFGDANDIELYDELHLDKAELLVSTIPDSSTNKLILARARKENRDLVIILTASHPDEALEFYELGADYVIIPHIIGGEHAAHMLEMLFEDMTKFTKRRHAHMKQLRRRGKR